MHTKTFSSAQYLCGTAELPLRGTNSQVKAAKQKINVHHSLTSTSSYGTTSMPIKSSVIIMHIANCSFDEIFSSAISAVLNSLPCYEHNIFSNLMIQVFWFEIWLMINRSIRNESWGREKHAPTPSPNSQACAIFFLNYQSQSTAFLYNRVFYSTFHFRNEILKTYLLTKWITEVKCTGILYIKMIFNVKSCMSFIKHFVINVLTQFQQRCSCSILSISSGMAFWHFHFYLHHK